MKLVANLIKTHPTIERAFSENAPFLPIDKGSRLMIEWIVLNESFTYHIRKLSKSMGFIFKNSCKVFSHFCDFRENYAILLDLIMIYTYTEHYSINN